MKGVYQTLFKHSAIYGVGQILSRLASFLLLPIYTNYLRPADYGVIAILDLFGGVLGILIGAGMASAVNRYYFDAHTEAERNQVWWTGLTFLFVGGVIILSSGMLIRESLAQVTLGVNVKSGAFYFAFVLPTLWFNTCENLLSGYLRIRKWSAIYVGFSLVRLLLNIGINLYFLMVLQLGVTGILLGNLLVGGLATIVLLVVVAKNIGAYSFSPVLARQLWAFGSPLILMYLLSSFMHQADRYFLRLYLDMSEVGVYSLGNTIGQAVNTLVLLPFSMIWNVVLYEVAQQPNAKQVYSQIFEYFFYGLSLLMLGVALFSEQLLPYLVAPDYMKAAEIIPIICLAYLFFSLSEHFGVPVKLAKRTKMFIPVTLASAATNLGCNMALIPWLGAIGAAWASVLTMAVYSFGGLWCYRRIEKYHYPLWSCGAVLIGLVSTYIVYKSLVIPKMETFWAMVIGCGIWLCWAIFLMRPLLRSMLIKKRERDICGVKVNVG